MDDLVKALGMDSISKCWVSELCGELDEPVERWRNRPLEGSHPYIWIDATYVKARQEDGCAISVGVVISGRVNGETWEREVLGLDVGSSEDGALWRVLLFFALSSYFRFLWRPGATERGATHRSGTM